MSRFVSYQLTLIVAIYPIPVNGFLLPTFYDKVKSYLEKRCSILFNHYEGFSQEEVPWLVQALENMQIAFSIHFGRADLSCLRQIRL